MHNDHEEGQPPKPGIDAIHAVKAWRTRRFLKKKELPRWIAIDDKRNQRAKIRYRMIIEGECNPQWDQKTGLYKIELSK